jgi:hypothetical protein
MANDEFQALFDRFKAILAPYAAKMHLSGEQPGIYGVDMAPEGKSCFNLTKVDEPLLTELERLTAAGYAATGGNSRWGALQRGLR